MALRLLSSILLLRANIGLSHEVLHSLRASNVAFAGTLQDQGFWDCKEYCVDTNTHGLTEGACTSECESMNPGQRNLVDKCKEDALPDSKPFDECYCEVANNCAHTGPGLSHTGTPTQLYTRPPPATASPVPSPTPPNNQRSGNANSNANENGHRTTGTSTEGAGPPTIAPRTELPSTSNYDALE
eukprot:scaffold412_cov118-Skeletonema_marinoi.AAC.8